MTDPDPPPEPLADPRTAPDDGEDAYEPDVTNEGVSSSEPAEGSDDAPGGDRGSPEE